MNAEF